MIRTSIFICWFFLQNWVFAQNQNKADSLKLLIANESLSDSLLLDIYYDIATHSTSPEDELNYGKLLLDLARQNRSNEHIAKAHLRIGVAHRLLGNLAKSFEHLFESADIASKSSNLSALLSNVYAEIATSYTQNDDSENAMVYGRKTIDILRKTNRKRELAMNLLNMGYDYYLLKKYDSAFNYYNESEQILEELDITIGLAYVSGNKALVYWKLGDYEKAKAGLFTAIEVLKSLDDKYGLADYYNKLGSIYMEEANNQEAIEYASLALELAEQEGMKEQIRDASYLLFSLNQKLGLFEKAIANQTRYYAYKDSIQNLETTQRLANLRTQFEVGQKQAEVDLLLEQKRNSQIIMITGGIIILIFIGLVLLIFSYYRSKTRLNQQLREQKDALVTLNNTKDKFFSIISHDLRGPAGVLRGLLFAIKRNWDDMDRVELKDILDQMENSAGQLVKLLDNLLHWALQQKGHFPYAPETLSLREVLKDVTDLFAEMAVSKDIALDLQLDEDMGIYADKNATLTIFRNLLNNALKFTPTNGRIRLIGGYNEATQHAEISVSDNGVGIPRDKLDILFDLNENISTKGTSGESGLGLGLQLVYEFVQLNNGYIKVDSELNVGTTFTIGLPLSKEPLPKIVEDEKLSLMNKYQ